MSKMKKTSRLKVPMLILFVLVLVLFIPSATSLGLAPCEMRISEVSGSGRIGTIVIVNSDDGPRWIKLQVMSPSTRTSEKKHMRVMCDDCHDSHQRYEVIQDYKPKEGLETLHGICPRCHSSNLTFFETPTETILKSFRLEGKDCVLVDEGNGVYKISEKIDFRDEKHIDIFFNTPEGTEFMGKHYEIHILCTSHVSLPSGMGIIPGIIMRLLIDTSPLVTSNNNIFGILMEYKFYVVGLSVFAIVGSGVYVLKSHRKKTPVIKFVKSKPVRNPVVRTELPVKQVKKRVPERVTGNIEDFVDRL